MRRTPLISRVAPSDPPERTSCDNFVGPSQFNRVELSGVRRKVEKPYTEVAALGS